MRIGVGLQPTGLTRGEAPGGGPILSVGISAMFEYGFPPPRIACASRGFSTAKAGFAVDSLVEGGGFESSVPRIIMPAVKCGRGCRAGVPCVTTELIGGTEGSNPAPSSGSHHIAVQCSGRVTDGARDGIGGETAGRRH